MRVIPAILIPLLIAFGIGSELPTPAMADIPSPDEVVKFQSKNRESALQAQKHEQERILNENRESLSVQLYESKHFPVFCWAQSEKDDDVQPVINELKAKGYSVEISQRTSFYVNLKIDVARKEQ